MATLRQIKDALTHEILGAMPDDAVFAYSDVPNVAQTPAIIVQPASRDTCNFDAAFQRGHLEWSFFIYVMVKRTEYVLAQEELTRLIDPNEEQSIGRALGSIDPTLGFRDGTVFHSSGIPVYGGEFNNASIPHYGAVIRVTVRTPGV